MQLSTVNKHDLKLGGLDLSAFKLHALDLSHVNAGLKAARVKPIVGVLGADILIGRKAMIDYGRHSLILADAQQDAA